MPADWFKCTTVWQGRSNHPTDAALAVGHVKHPAWAQRRNALVAPARSYSQPPENPARRRPVVMAGTWRSSRHRKSDR